MLGKIIFKITKAHKLKIYMLGRAQNILCALIKFYQRFISPVFGYHCRFYPSCSSYTVGAIEKCGLVKGLFRGFWRLLRCNPLNKGGVDLP